MAKLFNNIRKKLVHDKPSTTRTANYLKYAIGEIVLVVVGILIALSINNWNENRKSDKIRNNYYAQILQDLNKDTTYVHSRIKQLNSNIELYKNYIDEFQKQENVEKLLLSQSKLNHNFAYLSFNTNTIETLQSTGDIKLMPFEIRNALIDLKNLQEILIIVASGNDAVFLKNIMNAGNLGYSKEVFESTANKSNQLFTQLKVIENFSQMALILNSAYALKNATETEQFVTLKNMLDNIDILYKLINNELEK